MIKIENFYDWRFFAFATSVNDTGGKPWAADISAILEKIWNGPNGILRGLGKLIHEKNQKSKISWHCPFNFLVCLQLMPY